MEKSNASYLLKQIENKNSYMYTDISKSYKSSFGHLA